MVRGQWRSDPEDQLLAQFANTVLPLWIVLGGFASTVGMPVLGLRVLAIPSENGNSQVIRTTGSK